MTQAVILRNINKYLDFMSPHYIAAMERDKQEELEKHPKNAKHIRETYDRLKQEHLQYVEQLKKDLDDFGYCFGFSICHAAMDISGKLDWWEELLVELANWDGEEESLKEEVKLSQADPEEEINTKKKIVTRADLFERALHYTLFDHAPMSEKAFKDFIPTSMNQSSFLNTDAYEIVKFKKYPAKKQSFFELLIKNQLKTIKSHKKYAGYFSKENLNTLLDENQIQGNICLIHCSDHTIRIGYHDSKWMIYDSNSNHKVVPIHKSGKKDEIIDEMIKSLKGQSLCIEIASIEENKKIEIPFYEKLIENSAKTLIEGEGLYLLVRFSPKVLIKIFHQAKEKNDKELYSALEDALLREISVIKENGLQAIAQYSSDILPDLFAMMDHSKHGLNLKRCIANYLHRVDLDNWTIFHYIAYKEPHVLPHLFQLADDSKEGLEIRYAIACCLEEKEYLMGESGLSLLAFKAPQFLPQAIELALSTQDKEINWLDHIIETLASKNKQGIAAWEMINKHALVYKEKIIDVLVKHIRTLDIVTLENLSKDLDNALTNTNSPYREICKRKSSFLHRQQGVYGKTDIWKKLHKETEKTLKEKNKKTFKNDQKFTEVRRSTKK